MTSVLITGTSKGIGLATAVAMGRAGHDVYATMRNPSGAPELPDALPFLEWRNAMTDEAWVAWGALNDDDWYALVESDFGLQVRPTT